MPGVKNFAWKGIRTVPSSASASSTACACACVGKLMASELPAIAAVSPIPRGADTARFAPADKNAAPAPGDGKLAVTHTDSGQSRTAPGTNLPPIAQVAFAAGAQLSGRLPNRPPRRISAPDSSKE